MISVLIPVYNTNPEYLMACLNSVKNQTWSQFEIVIVDNGSSNQGTLEVLEQVKAWPNTNVYLVERQDGKKNLSIALNEGIKKCNFEYIARMDSDDIMLPDRLKLQIKYMILNPNVDILGCQLKNMFNEHETSHPLKIPQDFYKVSSYFICHPSVMYKKSKILELGGYPESPDHIPEDFVLWGKALKNGYIMHNLPEILVHYRDGQQSSLTQIDPQYKEWNETIYYVMREL